jgi:hypothetical protein
MRGLGFTVQEFTSSSGSLTSFAPSVKAMVLYLGCAPFTDSEVNALKQFASEGGRVIYVGEYASLYTAPCISIENDLLKRLGAVMSNVGNDIDCGQHFQLPAASLRAHQITQGMNGVTMGCSSEIVLGPSDFALYFDRSNTKVLAGVARIEGLFVAEMAEVSSSRSLFVPLAPAAADNNRARGIGPSIPPRR